MTAPTTPGPTVPPAAGPGSLVVGLDLSLTGTGIAYSNGQLETIPSNGKADATLAQRRERLVRLRVVILGFASVADLVVIEAPAFSRTTGHMHDRSGLWWGVVDPLIAQGIPVVEVTATSLKRYATGKGGASKDAVLAAVVRRYPTVEVDNNNTADALVLAAMGARHLGYPIDVLPQKHLEAMDAVHWPEAVAHA